MPDSNVVVLPTLMEAALEYAGEGLHIFPLIPGSKRPLPGSNGFEDATKDIGQVARWWQDHPTAGIGWAPEPFGRCVIDIDGAEGEAAWRALEAEHGAAPETMTIGTPSGGRHLIFAGSLPTTVKRLGPCIDTRGIGGYGVLPPTLLEPYEKAGATHSGPYTWLSAEGIEAAPLPAWIAPLLAKATGPALAAPDGVIENAPHMLARAVEYLQRQSQLIEGQGSDAGIIPMLCQLHDYAITADRAVDLVVEHLATQRTDGRPFDRDWIEEKARSAYKSAQNEYGARYQPPPRPAAEVFNLPAPAEQVQDAQPSRRYRGVKPAELANRPKATFWDTDHTLPRTPEGCRVVVAGKYSSHKTNLVLAKVLDATLDHGARVVFAAGEASEELGRERIPAQFEVRGIVPADLDRNLVIVEACPMLTDRGEVDAFIAEHSAFRPHFVVIDTLSEAITGQDENSAQAASVVMAEAGRIRAAWHCAVILVHHLGKDGSKGARGSSVFASGADAVWEASFDRDAGLVTQHIEKMRRGRAGFDVFHGTRIVLGEGDDGTMTVVPITAADAQRVKQAAQAGQAGR